MVLDGEYRGISFDMNGLTFWGYGCRPYSTILQIIPSMIETSSLSVSYTSLHFK